MIRIQRRGFLQMLAGGAGVMMGGLLAPGIWSGVEADTSETSMEFPWQIGPFVRPTNQPILSPNKDASFTDPITREVVRWEYTSVYNPAAIAWRDKVYLLYRAEDTTGQGIFGRQTSRVGLAESSDGVHFRTLPHPVLYPEKGRWEKYEWPGGCQDPRIVQSEDGTFVLTYTMWNRKDVPRLGIATSRDLLHWKHHGPAFRSAYGGRFLNQWSKAGAILTKKVGDQIVAAQVGGKYWMYWNRRETFLAHSHDLLNWAPLLDESGQFLSVLPKNGPGRFDSLLTEPGPPALLTDDGIVLLYNGISDGKITDGPRIPVKQGAGGQALFASDDPARLISRTEKPFFWPEEPWEQTGRYKLGVAFIEGLAWYQDKWFLFYGGADTDLGVAVAKESTRRCSNPTVKGHKAR